MKTAALARLELGQRNGRSSATARSRSGIGSPWGSRLGVAERGGDQLLELLGDVVLEHLGLVVDAVPRHPERLGEERLDQAVMAHHLEREPLARRREAHAVVGLVPHQARLVQALQHRGHGRRRDAEPLGER